MNEDERKRYPSFPPDYVTISQLQDRWLKNQQGPKVEEKSEQEVNDETQNLGDENQNQGGVERIGGRNEPGGRVVTDDREMGFIEERGKGKVTNQGRSEDGHVKKKKKKKIYWRKHRGNGANGERRNEVYGKVEKGNGKEMEKDGRKEGFHNSVKNEVCEDAENIVTNEVKLETVGDTSWESGGTDGIYRELKGSARINEVVPKNGVRRENLRISTPRYVRRTGYKRDENYTSKKNGVELHKSQGNEYLAKKMEDEVLNTIHIQWNENKWCDKLKLNNGELLGSETNEVQLKIENTAGDDTLEVCGGKDDVLGRYTKGSFRKNNRNRKNNSQEHRTEGETSYDEAKAPKHVVKDDVLVDHESGNVFGKGGVGYGFRRHGNQRGSCGRNFGNFVTTDCEKGVALSRVEMNVEGSRRHSNLTHFRNHLKIKEAKMWVKKEKPDGVIRAVAC